MRFLIVSAILACAAAAPSGSLLASSYSAPLAYAAAPVAVAHLAPALPTISAGDIHGAAVEARAEANDHLRAAVDANRQLHDKASELHGQAINKAEENAWRAVDAVKTVEAQWDGAAAGAAPVIAKSLVRTPAIAPVSYAAPVAYEAPVSYASGAIGYAAPAAYATGAIGYAAPAAYAAGSIGYAAPAAYATGSIGYAAPLAESKTVVSQSLSQTHPGAIYSYAASPLSYSHAW